MYKYFFIIRKIFYPLCILSLKIQNNSYHRFASPAELKTVADFRVVCRNFKLKISESKIWNWLFSPKSRNLKSLERLVTVGFLILSLWNSRMLFRPLNFSLSWVIIMGPRDIIMIMEKASVKKAKMITDWTADCGF